METQIERIREDRIDFVFVDDDAPIVELDHRYTKYSARVRRIYARFNADTGELLSVRCSGKKIKKNGEDSQVSAHFGWDFHQFDDDVVRWAREAGVDAREPDGRAYD